MRIFPVRIRNSAAILFTIGFFLSISAAKAGSARCALSPPEKAELANFISHLPEVPYSSEGFVYDDPYMRDFNEKYHTKSRLNFDPKTKFEDLLDPQGNVFLFRDIDGPYKKGFIGAGDKSRQHYIEGEGHAYSYSLSPDIVNAWGNPNSDDSVTLISLQNISQNLTFPSLPSHDWHQTLIRPRLERGTMLKDIVYFDEVKVPVESENVVATISQKEFKKLVDRFGAKDNHYRLADFLNTLLESQALMKPMCPATIPPAGSAPSGEETPSEVPESIDAK